MKVLVIGSGGREHALCWRLEKSPQVTKLYCAPGNPGTMACAENVEIGSSSLDALLDFASSERIDLTMVGPEQPLCDGIADRFERAGLRICGPVAAAAQLEGSKAFAKQFMQRHGIPTAPFGIFDDAGEAGRYIDAHPDARVIKADGLAAGKGVFLAEDAAGSKQIAAGLLDGSLGQAGKRVVIEQRLRGEEVSVIALSDGERAITLASSQDHKAAYDGDHGPNTGGMGAYSPAPVLDDALATRVQETIIAPAVRGLAADGTPYRGVLYAGLMIVDGAPQVLEFNCRFGDPETQPLMARFDDDIVPYLLGAAEGKLPSSPPRWDARAALCVVMAADGYPGSYTKGHAIEGVAEAEALGDVVVFHAGTALGADGALTTAGGRVLGVTALGDGIAAAHRRAYDAVEAIRWPGVHYRTDIGYRAL